MRVYMYIRIFDAQVREQDVWRALLLLGRLDVPLAELAMSGVVSTMP